MNLEQLRKICLGFPGVTEQIRWEDRLVFKVGGKMFAVARLEPAGVWLSLKADAEAFAELIERRGIIPAPYLARAKWIAIETPETLQPAEVSALLRKSYDLVCDNLPRVVRESLNSKRTALKSSTRRSSRSKQLLKG